MHRAIPHHATMTSLRLRHSCLCWLLILAALSCWYVRSAAAADPHEHVLANGMKVLLVEAPKAPVATVQVWYKVGSRNEVMGRAGLSHMLEHMMFKGTAKYPNGSFSRLICNNGGVDSAFTSEYFTAYLEQLSSD